MDILVVETQYESSEEWGFYNSVIEGNVDVVTFDEYDQDAAGEDYDVVLSELMPQQDTMGTDVLDQFEEVDNKALYTVWSEDEIQNDLDLSVELDDYHLIQKPSGFDLEELVQQEFGY